MQEQAAAKGILVIGSINTDLVVQVDRYPRDGETLIGHSFQQFAGGKGANQAVAAARLGARVTMVGRLGRDAFGDEQIQGLAGAGVDTSGIFRDPDAPSGIASITVDCTGRNRIIIVPGANRRVGVEDVETARSRIAEADMLLLQLEIPVESVARAIEIAAEVGTPVVLNPVPARPVNPDVLSKVDYLTPNEVEAEQLTGLAVKTPEDARRAAERLLSFGAGAVVVTLGNRGALVLEKGAEPVLVPAFKVEAVDTVAAGDAFNGALAVQLAEGASLVEAARYASAVAAIAVTRRGAQPSLPHRREVEEFLREAAM